MIKVHLIASRPTLKDDIDTLRKIISVIHDKDNSIAHDWIETAHKRLAERQQQADDWSYIYKLNLEAIAQAEVVIAETTYENFAVGYQVAAAVQQKKPVLLLRKKASSEDAFVTGVEDDWAQHGVYDDDTLVPIVEKFLEDNDIKTKDLRFNFFIDRQIYNYLRWASFRTSKTKAEILRELVLKEINKEEKP